MKNYRPINSFSGFTLLELITVLVILGLVAGLGSSFIVSTMNSYKNVQERGKLLNRGRLTIEQMTRQVRLAAPNSVRVSASGNCVEFLPLVAGVYYLADLPTVENGAPAITTLATAPFTVSMGRGRHAIIGALENSEIYSSGSPAARVATVMLAAGAYNSLTFSSSHIFLRDSISRRIFIADDPLRFCMLGNSLVQYSNYGFSTAGLSDADPGGNVDLMAEQVSTSSSAFTMSFGTQDVNTSLAIDLNFVEGGSQVNLRQEILIRNVP